MARRYRFLVEKLVRPYTSADDTDGHNIYEEVIRARMAFFVQRMLKDAVDMWLFILMPKHQNQFACDC